MELPSAYLLILSASSQRFKIYGPRVKTATEKETKGTKTERERNSEFK